MNKRNVNSIIKATIIALVSSLLLFGVFLVYYFIEYQKNDNNELRLWSIGTKTSQAEAAQEGGSTGTTRCSISSIYYYI